MYNVDVIIPTYNTMNMTEKCIDSIMKYSNIVPTNIIVVDNGTDNTGKYLESIYHNKIKIIINNDNKGYAIACNQGARISNSEYILFLNSDTLIINDYWLMNMINIFNNYDKVAVVGPKLVNKENKIVGCGVIGTNKKPIIRGWMESNITDKYNKPIECISVCGACYMIKRSNIKELGLFDESYPFYFEETDYSYNARIHGYKVMYCPTTTVIHFHQGSSKDNRVLNNYFRKGQLYFNNKFKEFLKDSREYK